MNLRVLQPLESFMIITVFILIFGYYVMKYTNSLGSLQSSILSNYWFFLANNHYMALENHTLLKDSFNMQDRWVDFNVTEVQWTKSSLIDVIDTQTAAALQGTTLLVDFWCQMEGSLELPEETIGTFLSQAAYLCEARLSSSTSAKIAHHNKLHRSNHENPADFCLAI